MLSSLIKNGTLMALATATQATGATHTQQREETVAPVAPVTVATPTISCLKTLARPSDREEFTERAAIIEANGISRRWAEGFAALCTMSCPSAYMPERWQQIVDDGGCFLDAWGREAAGLGWQASDIFGVNPDAAEWRYDGMGLLPLLKGRSVLAITGDKAEIDCGEGIVTTYRRLSKWSAFSL